MTEQRADLVRVRINVSRIVELSTQQCWPLVSNWTSPTWLAGSEGTGASGITLGAGVVVGSLRTRSFGDLEIAERLTIIDEKALCMQWRGVLDSRSSSAGEFAGFRDYSAQMQLTPISSSILTLIKWEGSITAQRGHARQLQSLIEKGYKDLLAGLQEHCVKLKTKRAQQQAHQSLECPASIGCLQSSSRCQKECCPSENGSDSDHFTFDSQSSSDSHDDSDGSSSVASTSKQDHSDPPERLASLSLGENSRMLRKSLSGKSEGSRRLSRSEPTGKNKAATAYRTLYADLGTALRKSTSGELERQPSLGRRGSNFAEFAQQSFEDARASSTHSRGSIERINSIQLPHYLQLQEVDENSCR